MCYHARGDFFENAVRHGMAHEAPDVDFIQVDGFSYLGVRGRFIDWEGFCCSV